MPFCWFSSDLSGLAHATVTGLPAETVGPAEIPQTGEVLPQHTAPGPNFGKEVGLAATVAMLCTHICIYIYLKAIISDVVDNNRGRDSHVYTVYIFLL